MSLEVQVEARSGSAAGISYARELLTKAHREGLSASESIFLKGELARLESRVAAVNTRFGREVVKLSPFARVIAQADVSAGIAL